MTQDEPSEVHRSPKPVVLKGDIRRTFVRSGGGGVRCSDHERNGLLIDAAAERPDGQAVDLNPATAFDPDAIRWYRAVYEARPGNRSCAAMSDADFLAEMGLLVEQGGRRLPTRAAVLIFGTNPAFRQLLPRPVVDCQWFTAIGDDADTGDRWFDRLVLDENLIRAWRSLIEDWYERFAEHPFRLDPATLRRDDTPPDYRAFRESMINLIMHQDYSDHSRKAVIRHYADKTVLWNPGDAFRRGRGSARTRRKRDAQPAYRARVSPHRSRRACRVGPARRVPELATVGTRAAADSERPAAQELRAGAEEGGIAL